MTTYTVKEKDTLWKIARHYKVTVDALADANNLRGKQLHYIRIGQILNIPNGHGNEPESRLQVSFRGLDFVPFTPKRVKVAYDGKEEEHRFESVDFLTLNVLDHARGLKVWIETLEKKMEQVLDVDVLPLGQWKLSLDSRAVKAEGSLQPKKGDPSETKLKVKEAVTHNAQLANGRTAHQQIRTEAGEPTHGLATIYTEKNLRLSGGNERYRRAIIVAADKYSLTPQSLAALIDTEAAYVADAWDEKSNQSRPKEAQGLAQFHEAAWSTVYQDEKSLLHQDCKGMSEKARLAKRLEAKYAIDGAASYASSNLAAFERRTNYAVSTLAAEDKAKMAYLLHHEGLTGTLRLFGLSPQLSDEDLVNRLRTQLGKDNIKALNRLLERYDNDPASAYKGWLFSLIDRKICIDHFVVQDRKGFATPPRSMAAIAKGLSTGFVAPKPKPRAVVKNLKPDVAPELPVPPAPKEHPDESRVSTIDQSTRWHDPLATCTLRTKGLSSKTGAMFGWTRNGGKRNHQGIDLAANPGTPIYAVADGIVYSKRSSSPSYAYGNTLVLEVGLDDLPPAHAAEFRRVNPHARTIGFFYAHLSELPDEPKKTVKCGDVIGKTGCTGNANKMLTIELGAHLHFEVRLEAKKLAVGLANRADPLPFIENCTNR